MKEMSKVLAVGCKMLPSSLDVAVGDEVLAATATFDAATAEIDCAAAGTCALEVSLGLTIILPVLIASLDKLLERADVSGASALPCSDLVTVTKEVKEFEEMLAEIWSGAAVATRGVEPDGFWVNVDENTAERIGADASLASNGVGKGKVESEIEDAGKRDMEYEVMAISPLIGSS